MKRSLLLLLLVAGPAWATDPPAPWIVPPGPVVPVPPAPPPPAPDATVALPADTLYVLDVREPCFYTVSPAGLLAVTQSPGPVTVYAKLYGGTGGVELKTYPGPAAVLLVRAVGTGRATITVTKVGAKTPADVFTQTIDALNGPLPPPTPPAPPPGPGVKPAWAVVVEDRMLRTPEQAAILGDLAFWQNLGIGWHHYDLNQPMPLGMKEAAAKAGSYPALVLLGPIPATGGAAPFLRAVPLPLTEAGIKLEIQK